MGAMPRSISSWADSAGFDMFSCVPVTTVADHIKAPCKSSKPVLNHRGVRSIGLSMHTHFPRLLVG